MIRRFDHWLLLRAPMLWRTRSPYVLMLLILLVIAALLLGEVSIKNPIDIPALVEDTMRGWLLQLFGILVLIVLWVMLILRRPVGELPIRRHVVTVVAVAVSSYLWLVAPTVLAHRQIKAIQQVDLEETM